MGRRGHPDEFRRKVPDPVETGRGVADVAHEPDIGPVTVHARWGQERIDRGLAPVPLPRVY